MLKKVLKNKDIEKDRALPLFKTIDGWIIAVIFFAAFLMRFISLALPSEPYFDEIYYQPATNDYMDGKQDRNWVHPPLAKILMAAGIKMTSKGDLRLDYTLDSKTKNSIIDKPGKNSMISYRIASCFFGALIVPLAYLFALYFFRRRECALITSLLINFDFLLFVLSRISLLDIFLVFFMLAASFTLWLSIDGKELDIKYFLLSSVLTGFATACKWNGAFILPLALFALFLYHRRVLLKFFPFYSLMAFLAYISVFSYFFALGGTPQHLWSTVCSAMKFQYSGWSHNYMAPLWKVVFMIRPIWLYYVKADGGVKGIIAMGNPFFWWSFIIMLIFMFYRNISRFNKKDAFLIGGYLTSFIFWIMSNRGCFFYYMAPALIWMSLIVTSVLMPLIFAKNGRIYISLYMAVVVASFAIYYPVLTAFHISRPYFNALFFLRSWI